MLITYDFWEFRVLVGPILPPETSNVLQRRHAGSMSKRSLPVAFDDLRGLRVETRVPGFEAGCPSYDANSGLVG
jgi:hypothetical protein